VDAGLAGGLAELTGDYLAVVGNNVGQNKIDFYAERSIRYEVWLEEGGGAWAFVEVELHNAAPTEGQPTYVIGPNRADLQAGDSLTDLTVYCGWKCERWDSIRDPGGYPGIQDESELQRTAIRSWLRVPAGDTRGASHTLWLPWAWEETGPGEGRYQLIFQDQPTIRPTHLEVSVHPPAGMRVTSASPDATVAGAATASWQGTTNGALQFEVAFAESEVRRTMARLGDYLGDVFQYWRQILRGDDA
jgi:hypothetical protein